MEKDERTARVEQNAKELAKLAVEIGETRYLLATAESKARESKSRSELYSRLERVSGIRMASSVSTTPHDGLELLQKKIRTLLEKEAELKKQILTSLADPTKLPFGVQEPTEIDANTVFVIEESYQIDSDALKIILGLVDMDCPCRLDSVIIDSKSIVVESNDVAEAVNRASDALERLRTTAGWFAETLFDQGKLESLCNTIHSGEKSYRPIVEEIGKHYPDSLPTGEIAKARNMRAEAVRSITSMLCQGKNWAGKCAILRRTDEGDLSFNSLGMSLWTIYQQLYPIVHEPVEKTKEEQKGLLSFSEK